MPGRSPRLKCKLESPLPNTMRPRHCDLFGASCVNADLRLAQRLLNWLLNQWQEPNISLPDIYQRSLNAIGDKATAAKLVELLEEHGSLVKIPEGAIVAGQRRRDTWRIVRG